MPPVPCPTRRAFRPQPVTVVCWNVRVRRDCPNTCSCRIPCNRITVRPPFPMPVNVLRPPRPWYPPQQPQLWSLRPRQRHPRLLLRLVLLLPTCPLMRSILNSLHFVPPEPRLAAELPCCRGKNYTKYKDQVENIIVSGRRRTHELINKIGTYCTYIPAPRRLDS